MKKKTAAAKQPKPVEAKRFRVLKDFHSDKLASDYAAGFVYTIRAGNNLLARLVKEWTADGLVESVDDKLTNISVAAGRGGVK